MAMRLERILLDGSGGGIRQSASTAGPSRTKRLRVDITSDFNCTFCMLAVKQLQLAMAKYNATHLSETLELHYRFLPYQLALDLNEEPIPRATYMRKKLGEKRAELLADLVRERLMSLGVQVHADPTSAQSSSTHLAHRLMTYALRTDPSTQLALAMNLFEAYHLDGQHLSDKDFLTYQAMLFNLFPNGGEARRWLDGDECDAEVRRAYSSAHRLGVTGVPFFVFQKRYAASGAMGVDEFVKLLEEIVRREDLTPTSSASPSPTSTFGGSVANGHTPHVNYHYAATHAIPSRSNGMHPLPAPSYQSHRHHPYRTSLSPGAGVAPERAPRLPSPLSHGIGHGSDGAFKVPSPPHLRVGGHTERSPGPGSYGSNYSAGRSPASTTVYSVPSPGVSAERSTAVIDL